jgi:hypothetical protein
LNNSKAFNLNLTSVNINGDCGIPFQGTRTSGEVPVITSGFLNNSKAFNSTLSLLNYNGDCGITVITSGCGPGNEGSTPFFRPMLKGGKNEY